MNLSRFLLLGFFCIVSCSNHQRVVLDGIPVVLNGTDPPFVVIKEANFSAPLDLCAVASLADVERVKWACENNYDVNTKDNNGDTPLHSIAMHSVKARKLLQWNDKREVIVVDILIGHGAKINATNHFGMTPLHVAALSNNVVVASALISHGANMDTKGQIGDSPLYVAVVNNSVEVIELLLHAGAKVDAKNESQNATALHIAAISGNIEIARLLLKYGANPNAKTSSGMTPIDAAKRVSNTEMADLLSGFGKESNLEKGQKR